MSEFGGDSSDFGPETGGESTEGTTETGGATETTTGTAETGAAAETTPGIQEGGKGGKEGTSVTGHGLSVTTASAETGTPSEGTGVTETPQQQVENFHQQSLAQILELHGHRIPESQRERIAAGVQDLQVVEYDPRTQVTGSFRYHNGQSSIRVSNYSEAQMERTTKHETNHFASFNRELVVPDEKGHTVHRTSGVRQHSYFHSKEGIEVTLANKNRAMNEGITTLYTTQQLEAIDPAKGAEAARSTGYIHAMELTQEMEAIVGKDVMADAYYGGNLGALESRVDQLGGEKAFENLSRCMDTVTYTEDPAERAAAMREAQDILATMSERKGKE